MDCGEKILFRIFGSSERKSTGISIAHDGIADMTINLNFRSLASDVGRATSRVQPISKLRDCWLTLRGILERAFAKCHYGSVHDATAEGSMKEPVARYYISIIHS